MIYHHSSLSRGMPKEERQNIGVCEVPADVATSLLVSHGVACNMGLRHFYFGIDEDLCNIVKLLLDFFCRSEYRKPEQTDSSGIFTG